MKTGPPPILTTSINSLLRVYSVCVCFRRLFSLIKIFSNNSSKNTIRLSKSLDPDQARHSVRPDLVQTVCKGYEQTTLVGKELNYME